MIRAFLAFDISEEIKKNLLNFVTPIRPQAKNIKWMEPKNYHVTLKFFGNIDEQKSVPAIEKIVKANLVDLLPIKLRCEGIGCFPKWERPKVIWADLKGEAQNLIALQNRLENDFEKLGFPKEDREFTLHLTLARIKAHPKKPGWLSILKASPQTQFGQLSVDHLTLYKSLLTKEGAVYTALKSFSFST